MKRLATLIALAVFLTCPAWAANDDKIQINPCPKTTMQRDCLVCHVTGNFKVRETAPDATRVYPTPVMKVTDGSGYYLLTEIDSQGIKGYFDYLQRHNIKKAVVEVHSPGGSLFDAQRIINLIQAWQAQGGTVETRVYGVAFSAGFYIFVSGDKRLVSKDADLMWHEIQSFEGFGLRVTTPSDKEEAARVLRHLQDVRHKYLATRGKLSKKEIDERVSKKEWWMTGSEAIRFGFADGLIQ